MESFITVSVKQIYGSKEIFGRIYGKIYGSKQIYGRIYGKI